MKYRIYFLMMVMALIASGCAKVETDAFISEPDKYEVVLSGDCSTKTSLAPEADGAVNVLWKAGDMLGIFVEENAVDMSEAQNIVARLASGISSGAGYPQGSFTTSLALKASSVYSMAIYYPYSESAGSAVEIAHQIPSVQTQATGDASRHLGHSGAFAYATATFSTPSDMQYYETPVVDFRLSHKTSTIRLSLKAADASLAGWKVKSASVKAPQGCALAGEVTYTPATDVFALKGEGSEKITLNLPAGAVLSAETVTDLFMVAFPTALAGKPLEITYTLEAADASVVKTVTHTRVIKDASKALKASTVHKFEENIPAADAEGWVYSTATSFDLSANGTANCYVVSVPGTYTFDATVMGNGQEGIMLPLETTHFHTDNPVIAPAQADLLWQTSKGLITDVSYADGRITFKKPDNAYGNAVITAKNSSGTILWSWHIWCTELGDLQTWISDYASYETMDRNLGATYAADVLLTDMALINRTVGMYYQQGRKDPYPGPVDLSIQSISSDKKVTRVTTALAPLYDIDGNTVSRPSRTAASTLAGKSIQTSIEQPLMMIQTGNATKGDWFAVSSNKGGSGPAYRGYYLWGNNEGYDYANSARPAAVKTIYDPCPVGYMVPPADWSLGLKRKEASAFLGGRYSADGYASYTWLPYAGNLEKFNSTWSWNGGEKNGQYWYSSWRTSNGTNASSLGVESESTSFSWGNNTGFGFQVRCIQEIN